VRRRAQRGVEEQGRSPSQGWPEKNDSQAVGETETESSAKQGTTGAEEKRMVGRPMFVDNM